MCVLLSPSYQIGDQIGQGAQYEVYKATRAPNPAIFAIAQTIANQEMLSQQAIDSHNAIMKVNGCPGVVQFFESTFSNNTHRIVMPYFPLGDLHCYLYETPHQTPLKPSCKQNIARQLVAGVKAIHARGVMHGDLKFANVLVSNENGRIQTHIADFGCAKPLSQNTDENSRLIGGCCAFHSPELLLRRSYRVQKREDESLLPPITEKVDMYALGIMLHWLLKPATHFPWEKSLGSSSPAILESENKIDGVIREMKVFHAKLKEPLFSGVFEPDPADRISAGQALTLLDDRYPLANFSISSPTVHSSIPV